ncbi:MAG: type II secretion system protein [Nitrospinae bacterium]|nr:type II secretion system protein [Nitrospinota bacterium]
MKDILKGERGFTLVELLIVVIILGILAAVVIPQFSASTQDANEAALDSDLSTMRNAIELYAAQHNSQYPGVIVGSYTSANDAFRDQLTQYTDRNHGVSTTKGAAFPYGPYIKNKIPNNPIPNALTPAGSEAVVQVDTTTIIISTPANNLTGWMFIRATGQFYANNTATDSNGNSYTNR